MKHATFRYDTVGVENGLYRFQTFHGCFAILIWEMVKESAYDPSYLHDTICRILLRNRIV